MENIYKDYGYENILLDMPCECNGVGVYPIKVKDWNKFGRYIKYFILSRQHYGIKDENSLLEVVFVSSVLEKNNGKPPQNQEEDNELSNLVIQEMCEAFSIITRTNNVSFTYSNGYNFILDNGKKIDDSNFEDIRRIILSQNILFEPIIYESEFQQKWAEKVRRGKMKKNKGIGIEEIINIVRCSLGISYKEISDMNMFQLYCDYRRVSNTKEFDTINILKTTYGVEWEKLPQINYTDSVIDKIIRNPELDFFKDFDDGGLAGMLK